MKIKTRPKKQREENVIPLINVVFLMLIFFLIAGTMRPFAMKDIKLADVKDAEKQHSKAVQMRIFADGVIVIGENSVPKEDLVLFLKANARHFANDKPFYILADKELEGSLLIEILKLVSEAGVPNTRLVAIRKAK